MMITKKINHYFLAFVAFSILTALLTYPIVLDMEGSFYGYPGDPFGAIWGLGWLKYSIIDLNESPTYSTLVGSPNGIYMRFYSPVTPFLSLPFTILFGEVFSYNFLILLSFILAGMGMYSLAYYLTQNKNAALISGIIFAFSPYHFAHAFDHYGLAQIQWIPFCILFLLKLDKERNYKNAFFFSIFLSLVVFSDPYYALFIILTIAFFILLKMYFSKISISKISKIHASVKNLKIFGIVIMPLLTFASLTYFFLVKPALIESYTPASRDLYELMIYSAKPWDFFLPPVYHPLFGRYVQDFVLAHLYGSNPIEQTLYIGYMPMALAILGIKYRKKGDFATSFFILSIPFVLAFMAPPYLPVNDLKIPFSLSYFLNQVIPFFRVMARFDVFLMLSVSVLAGIGSMHLLQNIQRWRYPILILIISIILFEFAPIPSNISDIKRPEQNFPFAQHSYSFHTTKIEIPSVYLWLANQEGEYGIIEYPLVKTPSKEEIIHYRYLFYQRIHKKRLVNGAPVEVIGEIANLSASATVDRLREFGVKYVIIHEDLGRIENITSELEFVKSFESALVYEVKE